VVDRNSDGHIRAADEIFDSTVRVGHRRDRHWSTATDPDNPTLNRHVNHPGIIRELAVAKTVGAGCFGGGTPRASPLAAEAFFIFDVAESVLQP